MVQKPTKLDVSNIIRGGPRKAKFNCELGRHGEHALESLEKDDLDFAVIDVAIPRSFLGACRRQDGLGHARWGVWYLGKDQAPKSNC